MMSLTPKQSETLAFIRHCLAETGVGPSFEEIGVAMGLAHRSGVHRLVHSLEERGAIRRQKYGRRAIEIIEPDILSTLDRRSNAELYRIATRCADIIKGRAG